MESLKNSSIKRKLMAVTMLAVFTAMLLACTAFVVNDVRLIQRDAAQQLTTLADVLGENTTAALTFDDVETAEQLLSSLRKQPMVTKAILYNAEGEVFATYPAGQPAEAAPQLKEHAGYDSNSGQLQVVDFINDENGHIGVIYLQGDLSLIREELKHYAVIVVLVMLVSFGAAYLMASRMQRIISGPIMDLTQTAQEISKKDDYRIRVKKHGNDELGILCDEFNLMLDKIEASKHELEQTHNELEIRVEKRTCQLSEANSELNNEIIERTKAEGNLQKAHRELLDAARKAGMAEVATGVLHNVGNVLNSVNVSATLLTNNLKSSKVDQLGRVVDLLHKHSVDLGDFITNNDKGKKIPEFLHMLSEHLVEDEKFLLAEAESLISNVEHIKTIVSTQQSYATSGGLVEPIAVNRLLDDAVQLHSSSFGRHRIELKKEYEDFPPVLLDRQRLMQIVINLIKNAKESLEEASNYKEPNTPKVLFLHTSTNKNHLKIEIGDTGMGIKKEELEKIFSHGFTTKETGHGFGLHSCANAATEMDGKLSVYSDGYMKGAVFTLTLPFKTATVTI